MSDPLGWDPSNPYPELGEEGIPEDLPPIMFHDSGAAPLPIGPAHNQEVARYVRVGEVSSDDLLTGAVGRFAHLDDRIARTTEWVQKYLADNNWVARITQARLKGDGSPEYREVATEIDRLALQFISRDSIAHGEEMTYIVACTVDEILGLGPIEPLMRDNRITEVMVNSSDEVYIEISGREFFVPGARFRSQEHLFAMCQRIVAPIDRSFDQKNAYVDARLPNGSRVNIVHQALAPRGPVVTIRKFPEKTWTMADLLEYQSIDDEMACVLAWLVKNRVNIIVAGGTGSGKTSLLNALSGMIPRDQRTITIEDSLELKLATRAHWIPLEARAKSNSGEGEVTIRDLVRNTLRMRPARIIVGEVRGVEALDMLIAMNTGHEGSLSTVHSNGPQETIERLLTQVAIGNEMSTELANKLIASAIDIIVYQEKGIDGVRRVTSISEILKPEYGGSVERIVPVPLWAWVQDGIDEDGYAFGHYEKRADISEGLRRVRRLQFSEPVTLEEVYALSEEDDRTVGGNYGA